MMLSVREFDAASSDDEEIDYGSPYQIPHPSLLLSTKTGTGPIQIQWYIHIRIRIVWR